MTNLSSDSTDTTNEQNERQMGHIILGQNKNQQPIALTADKFTRHAAIMGMTGSGKSGCLLNVAEQMVEDGVPLIMVDIKGDMCNVALQEPEMRSKMHFRVLTPGGSHGESIDLFSNLQRPERVKNSVTQILKLVGERNRNPLSSKHHVFLSTILNKLHKQGQHVDLVGLVDAVLQPPFMSVGALPVEDFYPSKTRESMAAKLNTILAAPSFSQWREGIDLNIDDLYRKRSDGKVNVTVYQVSHLDEDEKIFAIALLFDSIVGWMRRQRGSEELEACLMVDECSGILPPYPKNPETKQPIMTMLKQARAYGLGVILASQNPMDLDYKALSNCETWLVGRLQMANDRKRVIEAITAVTPHDRNRLEARIGRLQPRDFVLCRPKSTADFRSNDVKCDLVGPMTPNEVRALLWEHDPFVEDVSI